MPTAITPRMTIHSHQRLLAGSVAEDSRVPRSGSSMESRWPIRSLLSVKGNKAWFRVSLPGKTLGAIHLRFPAEHLEPTGKTHLRIYWTDLESKWLRSFP